MHLVPSGGGARPAKPASTREEPGPRSRQKPARLLPRGQPIQRPDSKAPPSRPYHAASGANSRRKRSSGSRNTTARGAASATSSRTSKAGNSPKANSSGDVSTVRSSSTSERSVAWRGGQLDAGDRRRLDRRGHQRRHARARPVRHEGHAPLVRIARLAPPRGRGQLAGLNAQGPLAHRRDHQRIGVTGILGFDLRFAPQKRIDRHDATAGRLQPPARVGHAGPTSIGRDDRRRRAVARRSTQFHGRHGPIPERQLPACRSIARFLGLANRFIARHLEQRLERSRWSPCQASATDREVGRADRGGSAFITCTARR